MVMAHSIRRPGLVRKLRTGGRDPYRVISLRARGGRPAVRNTILWLWVPAFAGTTALIEETPRPW
jgi:hypothetical protein